MLHRTESQAIRIKEKLQAALRINPRDEQILRAGTEFYKRFSDFKTAAMLLTWLKEVRPLDGQVDAALGDVQYRAGDLEGAERSLLSARERKAAEATVAEELARIRLTRKDDAGALRFLDESLAKDGNNAELWFTRADVAGRLGDWPRQAESLERGLALHSDLPHRTSLIELYIEHGNQDKALNHLRTVSAALPNDGAARVKYADFLERVKRPEEALIVWQKALESDPKMELAHFRISHLLLERGDVKEALSAAAKGLEVNPKSGSLYIAKAEAEERQGDYFAARQTLRRGAESVTDTDVLARLAEMEDAFGRGAARVYLRLLQLRKAQSQDPNTLDLLQRGLFASLRDEDAQSAAEFRRLLAGTGRISNDAPTAATGAPAEAVVPGGLAGLEFVAQFKSKSPQRYFAEYCRTLVDRVRYTRQAGVQYTESIRSYFETVAGLRALAFRNGDKAEIVLSPSDKKDRQRTEKVLDLLGWKMRSRKEGVTLEAGEKASQAKRQETASALAIDEVGLQDALQAGRSFRVEIADGKVPVLLGESRWMATFFPKQSFAGGFAEAMTHDLRVAKVYAGLSSMGSHAAELLATGSDLKVLADKYSDLMYEYSSAFALEGLRASVPGGADAVAVWEKLVGAPPSNPPRFYRSLLDQDDGKLLSFFSILGQLDIRHQRFFTRSVGRTKRFYELYRDSRDIAQGAQKEARGTSFLDFLREVPLDEEGRVLFPGGPEVWMVAKGASASVNRTTKMTKKLSRVTVPEQEDEILLRLAGTRYGNRVERISELDNFVAVTRIEQHRDAPLEAAAALMLAQRYAASQPAYPYFTSLTGLTTKNFEGFFSLLDKLRDTPRLQMNSIMGHTHSLLAILSLAEESGRLKQDEAANLFGMVTERFGNSAGEADYARASLEVVRELLKKAKPADSAGDPDRSIEEILIDEASPAEFEFGGTRFDVTPAEERSRTYRKVLDLQSVPSFKALLGIYDAATLLGQAKGSAADHLARLDTLSAALPSPEPSKEAKDIDRKLLSQFDRSRTIEIVGKLKQQTARKKPNSEEVKKLCRELLASVEPQVRAALSGVIYAFYLRPQDLLIAHDPLFLRKHRFVDPQDESHALIPVAELRSRNEGAGSYVVGGFADFAPVAGRVAWSGSKVNAADEFVAAAQIGSIRASSWGWLTQGDLIVFELRARVAKEWILHAATDERLYSALAQDITGVISPTRGARLMESIALQDWAGAFENVTLGDLYFLSGRYLDRYSKDLWQSPAISALRKRDFAESDERLRRLGASGTLLRGCSHPHLEPAGSYEEYENLVLPYKLAERSAELKLYLADVAARAGIPVGAVTVASERVAVQVLSKMHMNDMRDWPSAMVTFGRLDESVIADSLSK